MKKHKRKIILILIAILILFIFLFLSIENKDNLYQDDIIFFKSFYLGENQRNSIIGIEGEEISDLGQALNYYYNKEEYLDFLNNNNDSNNNNGNNSNGNGNNNHNINSDAQTSNSNSNSKNESSNLNNNTNQTEENRTKEYVFKVSYKDTDFKDVNLSNTINKDTLVNEKIAPGTSGGFEILLETNQKINYQIKFESKNDKPKNLVFKIDGKDRKYENLEDMEQELQGEIEENKRITINWEWEYEKDAEQNIQDTKDGEKLTKYNFTIYAIGYE